MDCGRLANHVTVPDVYSLVECESDQAGAKQDNTCNGHSEKAFGSEFIPHGTPPIACPSRRREQPCLCTVKKFPSKYPISMHADVLMQHPLSRWLVSAGSGHSHFSK